MLVSPQAKVSSVWTPPCYALCFLRVIWFPIFLCVWEQPPGALAGGQEEELGHSGTGEAFAVRSKHSKRDCEHERDPDPSCLFESCEFCRFWSDAEFIQVSGGIWYEGSRVRFLNENACIREWVDGAQPRSSVTHLSFLCASATLYLISGPEVVHAGTPTPLAVTVFGDFPGTVMAELGRGSTKVSLTEDFQEGDVQSQADSSLN